MAKRPLPPKVLGKGDTVRFGDMIGVVSGDYLSPGGMRGFLEVTVFYSQGIKVHVRKLQALTETLIDIPVRSIASYGTNALGLTVGCLEYDLGEPSDGTAIPHAV